MRSSITRAWDSVWNAVAEVGIQRPYDDPHGPYLPVGDNGVSYGQMVVDRLTELQQTRLTAGQVETIAELIRDVAKAAHIDDQPRHTTSLTRRSKDQGRAP